MSKREVTYTFVGESKHSCTSVAPNGSSRNVDHYTTRVYRQDWANVPENKIYAGRSYRVVETWLSLNPDVLGQRVSLSSSPWVEVAS